MATWKIFSHVWWCALATRARAPHRRYVKQLIASFDRLRCGLLVEGVDLDGDYRVILIMVATADVRAVTNIHLLRDEEQERETPGSEQRPKLFARGPSHLTEYVLAGNQGDVVAQEVAGVEFDAGIGGKKTLLDGTVQFLTVKREGRPSIQTALYGYEYPAFDGSWDEPEGIDLPRWNAVVLAYDVWRRLMKQHMESIRVVAPGEVQPS